MGCVLANGGKANNGRDFNFQPYTVLKNHQKCLIFIYFFKILFESGRFSVQLVRLFDMIFQHCDA